MTARLFGALKAHRHLRSDRIFCHADGNSFSNRPSRRRFATPTSGAGLRPIGTHVLLPSYLLLAPLNARCGAEGDLRARGALDACDDLVTRMTGVHAMQAIVGEGVRQSPICRLPLQVRVDRHALAAIRSLEN
jgi:hypothetical protein